MSVKVFTAEEALAAANADVSKILSFEKKKEDKAYKGTRFLNVYVTIGAEVRKEPWFSVENIPLSVGVADPENAQDKRNEFESTRLQLETTLSRAGPFGQFLKKLDPEYRKIIAEKSSDGSINISNRKIHGLLQTHLSEENPKNPGAEMDDPAIRFKIDFGSFPQMYKHKFLIGQPRTQIFDYRTRYVDENGREQFKAATIVNDNGEEEPVTSKNLHKFVTRGSILHKGRVMMPSLAISSNWVSIPIIINRAVIEPGGEDGFSDDGPVNAAAVKSAIVGVQAAVAPAINNTGGGTASAVANTAASDVDSILNDI